MIPIHAVANDGPQCIIDDIDRSFNQLTPEKLFQLARAFLGEFKKGLNEYGFPMAMIPTFVTGVPDGTETGTFLALDLGGTNMRVCEIKLNGDKTFSLRQQKYKVSDALKTGEATALFDYLADSVDAFLTTHTTSAYTEADGRTPDVVHLGLTFSFPVEQTALNSGKILTWTKGFSVRGAVGNDVVKLLQDAFDRKHMHVQCVALVNDTVGTLLTRAYTSGNCLLGAIFGTGTNGAYVEKCEKLEKMGEVAKKERYMIVNTEWGAFDNSRSHLPTTPFDSALDRLSINPSCQAFEKFISGMYLGEITRTILTALIDATPQPLLFNGKSTHILNTHYGLDTSVMSHIEVAWEGPNGSHTSERFIPQFNDCDATLPPEIKTKLERVRQVVIKKFCFTSELQVTLRDAAIVQWASFLVARRAALLSGVAVATVLFQTERASLPDETGKHKPFTDSQKIHIGVDGSLIEHYPNFERLLRESLRLLAGEDVDRRVDIGLAKDGSGVGAALCALQATRQHH